MSPIAGNSRFEAAFPYQKDVSSLPVTDLEAASAWYGSHFGMSEVERHDEPVASVVLERDGIRLGFALTGGDPAQDGAAIRVVGIESIREELVATGVKAGDLKVEEQEGKQLQAFFVVAPDGLCFYFHEPIPAD